MCARSYKYTHSIQKADLLHDTRVSLTFRESPINKAASAAEQAALGRAWGALAARQAAVMGGGGGVGDSSGDDRGGEDSSGGQGSGGGGGGDCTRSVEGVGYAAGWEAEGSPQL